MTKITPGPSADRVRELFDYDPSTGLFRWRKRFHASGQLNGYFGRVAGSQHKNGYWTLVVDGRMHNAQRIAWLYMTGEWPNLQIDHANLVKNDNRFENLRKATVAQNGQNRGISSRNTSGVKGVSFCRQTRKWKAHTRVNRRGIDLGRHETIEAAVAAYAKASIIYHGEFAR